jgi:hypothetical protein
MTNRIEYLDKITETTKQDEVWLIALNLENKGQPLSLENAQAALRQGLQNAPEMWKLSMDDLPGLWAELVTGV